MERTMSFASWLLPRHPSSLLGGVASSVGPFPASGTPGLAPLCPGSGLAGYLHDSLQEAMY